MKSIACSIIGLWVCLSFILLPHRPLAAQDSVEEPRINLSAANQPLAEVLDQITSETGYQFNLSPKWENHRVSATLNGIPLEQGLKRLLRSLNHSIVWESNRIVTILVYGKAESGRDGGTVSFAPPPMDIPSEEEPGDALESEDADLEESEAPEEAASGGDSEAAADDADEQDDGTAVDSDIPKE